MGWPYSSRPAAVGRVEPFWRELFRLVLALLGQRGQVLVARVHCGEGSGPCSARQELSVIRGLGRDFEASVVLRAVCRRGVRGTLLVGDALESVAERGLLHVKREVGAFLKLAFRGFCVVLVQDGLVRGPLASQQVLLGLACLNSFDDLPDQAALCQLRRVVYTPGDGLEVQVLALVEQHASVGGGRCALVHLGPTLALPALAQHQRRQPGTSW